MDMLPQFLYCVAIFAPIMSSASNPASLNFSDRLTYSSYLRLDEPRRAEALSGTADTPPRRQVLYPASDFRAVDRLVITSSFAIGFVRADQPDACFKISRQLIQNIFEQWAVLETLRRPVRGVRPALGNSSAFAAVSRRNSCSATRMPRCSMSSGTRGKSAVLDALRAPSLTSSCATYAPAGPAELVERDGQPYRPMPRWSRVQDHRGSRYWDTKWPSSST
jgi:hypothetical protein